MRGRVGASIDNVGHHARLQAKFKHYKLFHIFFGGINFFKNLSLRGWAGWSGSTSLGLADRSMGELVEGNLTTQAKAGTADSESGDMGDMFPLQNEGNHLMKITKSTQPLI